MSGVALLLAQLTGEQAPGAPPAATNGAAEFWVFLLAGALALGAALGVVLVRNTVHSAMLLVLNFLAIAVLYLTLEAQFLATVQIIVYAGAIMVLFLFVIMLLGVVGEERVGKPLPGQRIAAVVLGVLLLGGLGAGVAGPFMGRDAACNVAPAEGTTARCAGLAQQNNQEGGNVRGLGGLLFTRYVWPFEVTSVLLVVAALGTMVLGRKREAPSQLGEGSPVQTPRREPLPESDPDVALRRDPDGAAPVEGGAR